MFIIIDNDMKDELAGTTANVVLLKGNRIFCVSKRLIQYYRYTEMKKTYFLLFFDKYHGSIIFYLLFFGSYLA